MKCNDRPGSTHKQTLQQHHKKAAEHHDLACKHHKEAGKCCESNDLKTAARHAQIAHGHTALVTEHGVGISKNYAIKHYSKIGIEGGVIMSRTFAMLVRFIGNYRYYRGKGLNSKAAWNLASTTLP